MLTHMCKPICKFTHMQEILCTTYICRLAHMHELKRRWRNGRGEERRKPRDIQRVICFVSPSVSFWASFWPHHGQHQSANRACPTNDLLRSRHCNPYCTNLYCTLPASRPPFDALFDPFLGQKSDPRPPI